MKIKPKSVYYHKDYTHSTFDIIEYCCEQMKTTLDEDGYAERDFNVDDTIDFGHGHDYWVCNVKYCPHCGKKIDVER